MSTVSDKDREEFLKVQREIHGDEFQIPDIGSRVVEQPKQSMFAMYREALGAPQTLKLECGTTVMVCQPKVKTIKYLLAKADKFQQLAEESPVAVLDELQAVMLQCVEFPDGNKPDNLTEWFEELGAVDGGSIVDAFSEVFDLSYLMKRASQLPGKK